MRRLNYLAAPLLLVLALFFSRADSAFAAFRQVTLISIPGKPVTSTDFIRGDPASDLIYLADHDNFGLDIFNPASNQFFGRVDLSSLPTFSGRGPTPADIAFDDGLGVIITSLGNGQVAVINKYTNQITGVIPSPTTQLFPGARADLAGYDSVDHVFAVGLKGSITAFDFISINPTGGTVISTLPLPNDSPEEPRWDLGTNSWYLALETSNTVGVVSTATLGTIQRSIQLPNPCRPHSVVIGPNENAMVTCSSAEAVVSLLTGQTLLVVPGSQAGDTDEGSYDPTQNLYYAPGDISGGKTHVLAIINALTNQVQEIDTIDPSSGTQGFVTTYNHEFFDVILAGRTCPSGCMGVWTDPPAADVAGTSTGAGTPFGFGPFGAVQQQFCINPAALVYGSVDTQPCGLGAMPIPALSSTVATPSSTASVSSSHSSSSAEAGQYCSDSSGGQVWVPAGSTPSSDAQC